jgi:hypothetical protein
VQLLPLGLLLLNVFSIGNLSEILMSRIDSELLISENGLESLVLSVGLERAYDVAVVLVSDEQL